VVVQINFAKTEITERMKVIFQITSKETGRVLIKRRKIAKALRWWLRENGIVFDYRYFLL
jgi:predicted RNA-binding protein YlqC (UPF0109 family)